MQAFFLFNFLLLKDNIKLFRLYIATLRQMPRTIKLMKILQIGKPLRRIIDYIMCVQIAVLILCRTYNVDRRIRKSLELLIRVLCERITDRLDPFGKIRILKDKTVKTILQMLPVLRQRIKFIRRIYRQALLPVLPPDPGKLCRQLETAHAIARLFALDLII